MNSVNLIGNICNDLNLEKAGEMNMLRFTVAIQRDFKNKKTNAYDSDFITCKAFGSTADIIQKYFSKGKKIGISGKWQTGNYEKDGVKIYTNECIINNITFIEKNDNSQNNDFQPQANNSDFLGVGIEIEDSDLPF